MAHVRGPRAVLAVPLSSITSTPPSCGAVAGSASSNSSLRFCYCPPPLPSAISESATAIAKPRALRIIPPAETTRAVPITGTTPDHDCLDVVGGDPAFLGGLGVGEVGGRRCVHRDQGGQPREHELASWQRIVLDRWGGDVGKCVTVAALQATAWGGAAAGPGHQHHLPHRASIAALAGEGFPVTATDILTAPVIATAYLKEHYPGARCLLLNIGDIGEDLAGVALPTRTTRPVSSSNGFT